MGNLPWMPISAARSRDERVQEVANFLAHLKPARAYLAIPTPPPAEVWAHAPDEESIVRAHQILGEKVEQVECLIGYEGNAFASTGSLEEDLLGITAVHPMREEAVGEFLSRARADWSVVHGLIARDRLVEMEYGGHWFYMRKLHGRSEGPLR